MSKRGGSKVSDTVKARQAKSKQLAKRYQHEAAMLKQKGILTARVNARKNITRATRTKINKFRDVIEGRAIAVPADRKVRTKYRDAHLLEQNVLEERGRFLVLPKEFEGQRARIKKGGIIEVTRPLKNGQESYVILPFALVNMNELVERLKTDPTLDGLKKADEMFSFRLDGYNSQMGFVDAAEMGEYIQLRYQHLFKPGVSRRAVKFLTFQRFKQSAGEIRNPHESKEQGAHLKFYKPQRETRIPGTYERQRLAARAAKKARQRDREQPEDRTARLAKQRIRQAQYRQRKFDEE